MSATTGHDAGKAKEQSAGEGDVDGVGVSGGEEFTDPAILTVGMPTLSLEFRYSRDDLLRLRKAPQSQKRPDYLETAYFNNNGVWDPEPWHYSNKNADGPAENGARPNDTENHKRRPGDPRERIRKEQDGIVLSPQRRSFNSGCFVPVREPLRPNRPLSPLGGKPDAPPHLREINAGPPARRIGSGRILPWDFQEKSDVDNDFGYRRERRETDRERDDRFDRRSFSRDFEGGVGSGGGGKEKERHIGRNNNNNNNSRYNRRISGDHREEEPEWFSSGPMSQNDTIELRGFDESEKVGNKKKAPNERKKAPAARKKKEADRGGKEADKGGSEGAKKSEAHPPQDGDGSGQANKRATPPEQDAAGDGPHVGSNDSSFNFEDILKCDSIPGLLSNGVESGDAAGSRFSRWFQREKSPPNKQTETSRRSSLQDHDHHHIIKNLLGDQFSEPTVKIPQPGDSESYFAPISPAASSVLVPQQQQQQQQQQAKSVNLMEMLQRGNKHGMPPLHGDAPPPPIKGAAEAPGAGKIISLEELEARMIQGAGKHQAKHEEDMNAFKRLGNSGMNHHTNGPAQQKPMSIMEMLSHSQQQDEAARMATQQQRLQPAQFAELSFKMQQAQNQLQQQKQQAQLEMLSKLMNAGMPQTRSSPLQEMGLSQSRELLNRPEAQAILQGLKRGDITPQHLYQQLANPAMQPRHRDLLLTILKMQQHGSGGMLQQQQTASPVPPPLHVYQQQLRVSPLPPNAYCVSPILATSPNTLSVPAMHQRIPSPRELQVHTQNIMQRALIKKKLEEQEENFRKKQTHRGGSPAKTASPTPLAFTPTAVLRKMTADKDEVSKDVKGEAKIPQGRAVTGLRTPQPSAIAPQQPQNWNNQFPQHLKQPAGRPIVKANNNYQPASQTQQQEQYFQQQRLLQQQRKNQQTFGTNFVNQVAAQSQQFQQQQQQQLSHQQMRAQHQNVRAQHQQQQPPFGQQPWAMLQGQNFENSRQVGRGGLDGDLSPTSNQLARWFSPDLLDRARKGKLPGIPQSAVAQHALSLEEVERQTTPVGHN